LYDALPYIYIGSGLLSAILIANTLAFISGTIFGAIAVYIFMLRGAFTKKYVIEVTLTESLSLY